MSTTVQHGSMEVTSTGDAEEILAALTPEEDDKPKPRVTVDKGEPVEPEPEKEGLAKAASELGKEGGKAAAKARAAKAAEPEVKEAAEPAEEPGPAGKDEAAEAKSREGNPRYDPRARISQLAREKREVEAAAAQERRQREQLEARLAEIERKVTPAERPAAQPVLATKPKVEDFEDFDQYLDARDKFNRQDWEREQTDKQRDYMAHEQAAKTVKFIESNLSTYHEALVEAGGGDIEAFRGRISENVKALHPSFVLEEGERPEASHILADLIIRAGKKAPALLLHFSEHDDDLQRILALRSREDVRVETRLIAQGLGAATAGASARPKTSQAPPPLQPVSGAPHTADRELGDDAPLSAFVSRFGQRELASRR